MEQANCVRHVLRWSGCWRGPDHLRASSSQQHASRIVPCVRVGSRQFVGWTTLGNRSRGRFSDYVSTVEPANDVGLVLPGRTRWHGLRLKCRYSVDPLDLWPSSPYEHTNGP